MGPDTVESDYGPLTIHDDCADLSRDMLPKLQFEGADLLIKLDQDSDSWLVIHKDLIRATCPILGASLTEAWDQTTYPKSIQHPDTGENVVVRCLALKQVDGTVLLEGQDVQLDATVYCSVFSQSVLALPGWPLLTKFTRSLPVAKRALRTLFATLYNAKVDFDWTEDWDLCMCVAVTVCAYAEYWGCLDIVGPRVLTALRSTAGFWDHVSTKPDFFYKLSIKLKDSDLFYDSFRHMVANARGDEAWRALAAITGHEETELRRDFEKQFTALNQKLREIYTNLQKLGLHRVRAHVYSRGWQNVFVRFLNILQIKSPDRSDHETFLERPDFLGRAIYSEYLLHYPHGDKVDRTDRRDRQLVVRESNVRYAFDTSHIDLISLIHEIEEAAESTDPATIFDSAVHIRYAAVFKLSQCEALQVQRSLQNLVRQASALIKASFEGKNHSCWAEGNARRAHFYTREDGCSTYLHIRDCFVPHEVRFSASATPKSIEKLEVQAVDISASWLEALIAEYNGMVVEQSD